jgi:hypothetical protein
MIVLDVEGAAEFLKVSVKTARALIVRLPHGDASRSPGPNKKLVIAQETLERFVLGEIEPEPVGSEGEALDVKHFQRGKYKYVSSKDGPIPKRAYR